MAYTDEAIIKLRAEVEKRKWASHIDLNNEQILYGEAYQFEQRYFFDSRVSLMIPNTFSEMPEDIAAEKYLTSQKPQVILSNHDYSIDITLNLLQGTLKTEQIPLCLQKLKNTIREVYPATLFYDEELLSEEDITVAYMDFKSFSLSGPVYNVMFVTSICGQALIGTLNCAFDYWEQWKPVAHEMIKTVREIKE